MHLSRLFEETASEDDGIRPPLPVKSRETDTSIDGASDGEADYSNLPSDLDVMENHVRSSPSTPSLRGKVSATEVRNHPQLWEIVVLAALSEVLRVIRTVIQPETKFSSGDSW